MTKKTKPVRAMFAVRLDAVTLKRLRAFAKRRSESISDVVRRALAREFQ